MKKTTHKLTSFTAHLNKEYGLKGATTRELYEQEFEIFKLGVMHQDLKRKMFGKKQSAKKITLCLTIY